MTARPYDPAIAPRGDQPVAGYHALSALAMGSLALGAVSALGFLGWFVVLSVPPAAIVLGLLALRRIHAAPQELTGAREALGGIVLAILFFFIGAGWLIVDSWRDVPTGYEAISYETLQPDKDNPGELPGKAVQLAADKKQVFIKGYMMPARQLSGLKHFILCPTNGVCPYCIPKPTPTEQIRVTLDGDLTAEYTTRLIGIGGLFGVDPKNPSGIPYAMDVNYLK